MTEDQVTAMVRDWQTRLGLATWAITIEYGEVEDGDGECEAEWEYNKATVRFNLEQIEEGDTLAFVVHELLHCVTRPLEACADGIAGKDPRLMEWTRQATEKVVSDLERMVLRLTDGSATTPAGTSVAVPANPC